MTSFKYIAAVLALVGAVGSAQAADEVKNDQIQFMGDHELNEVVGTRFVGMSMFDAIKYLDLQLTTSTYSTVTANERRDIVSRLIVMNHNGKRYDPAFTLPWIIRQLNKYK